MRNKEEIHSTREKMVAIVAQQDRYQVGFDSLYSQGVMDRDIRHAIASYVRSLHTFDCKLDRNTHGEKETFTSLEIEGFNLFMGKAVCGTCHFAPVSNGIVPPHYKETELENLGVPVWQGAFGATIDPDLGRGAVFGVPSREFFFKTPTLRNVALTKPYLHNGVYKELAQVFDFYNRGGGIGIGIDDERQTLPADALDL